MRSRPLSLLLACAAAVSGCGGGAATNGTTKTGLTLGPGIGSLPSQGIAVVRGSSVVLLRLDGTPIRRLPGFRIRNGSVLPPDGPAALRAGREPQYDYGCIMLARRGPDQILGCSERGGRKPGTIRLRRPDGRTTPLVGPPPRAVVGHWAAAYVSPDRLRLLLQWSAECEIPIAFFAPAAGGTPQVVTGEGNWADAPESVALGWRADGKALVFLPHGACGGSAPVPGVYTVDGPSKPQLLARGRDALLWRR